MTASYLLNSERKNKRTIHHKYENFVLCSFQSNLVTRTGIEPMFPA